MLRIGVPGLLAGLLLAGPSHAGMPTGRFMILASDRGYLSVTSGSLYIAARSTLGAISDNKDARHRWYIDGTRIKSTTGGGYLAYDPTGMGPEVRLVPHTGPGTEWDVAVPGRSREGVRAVIRAAQGPYRGWLLTFEVQREVGPEGRAAAVVRILLAKDPAQQMQAERIFEHK